MNCQDIALILDDSDVANLDAATTRAVDAHLHACPACAADWKLHLRLAHKVLPPVPAGLAAACRTLATGAPSRTHPVRRLVVVGGMALAAAAALWIGLRNPSAPASAPVAVVVPSQQMPVQGEVREETAQAAAPSTSVRDEKKNTPAGASVQSFSVLLLTPDVGTEDAAIRAAARQFHERILEALRTVPGVTVAEAESASGREADYIIEYGKALGQFRDPEGLWRFQVNVHVPRSSRNKQDLAAYDEARAKGGIADAIEDGYVRSFGYSSLVSLGVPCKFGMCPARQAADVVNMLRLNAFRHDVAKQHELFARFMDPGTSFATRQNLLRDFDTLAGTGRATPVDAQFIRAILELHADAPDRAQRLALWSALAQYSDGALIEPIVTLVRQETDEQVRAALIAKLVATFSSDAKARRALEEISAGDSSELVRQVARRAIAGDEEWVQYVSATIQDVNLSPQQRWEPMDFFIGQGNPMSRDPGLMQQFLGKLDGEAIAALAEVLPRIWVHYRPERDINQILRLQNLLSRLKDPAIARLLLRSLDGGSPFSRSALVLMLEKYIDDAPVVEALEKIHASDADPKVRDAAARVLDKRNVPADRPGPNP
jgi:hypothetical protein